MYPGGGSLKTFTVPGIPYPGKRALRQKRKNGNRMARERGKEVPLPLKQRQGALRGQNRFGATLLRPGKGPKRPRSYRPGGADSTGEDGQREDDRGPAKCGGKRQIKELISPPPGRDQSAVMP